MIARTLEQSKLKPLAQAAVERALTREQMLRVAMRDRTAVQREGRWFVQERREAQNDSA